MEKKITLILIMVLTLTGCSSKDSESIKNFEGSKLSLEDIEISMNSDLIKEGSIEDIIAEIEADAHEKSEREKDKVAETEVEKEEIDIDLTVLSSTLVASQVYDMLSYPEAYEGDLVKMAGQFTYFLDETTNKKYYSCLIKDAEDCCQTGIEFRWQAFDDTGELPVDLANIEVIGIFTTYEENGFEYVTLEATSVVIN